MELQFHYGRSSTNLNTDPYGILRFTHTHINPNQVFAKMKLNCIISFSLCVSLYNLSFSLSLHHHSPLQELALSADYTLYNIHTLCNCIIHYTVYSVHTFQCCSFPNNGVVCNCARNALHCNIRLSIGCTKSFFGCVYIVYYIYILI